jgi:hypothetical protein
MSILSGDKGSVSLLILSYKYLQQYPDPPKNLAAMLSSKGSVEILEPVKLIFNNFPLNPFKI